MIFNINQNLLKDKHTVVFYNQSPIFDLKSIDGFVDDVEGVTANTKLTREFTYSFDNNNWSPYQGLTDDSIKTLPLDKFLFLRFKYTRVGDVESEILTVKTFELKYQFKRPNQKCGIKPVSIPVTNPDTSPLCNLQYQDININNGILCNPDFQFDPYKMTQGFTLQQDLNLFINKNLGVEVKYFRTDPDIKTADSFLGEYSLKGVVEVKCIKIVLPENMLPSNKPQYDEWGLGFDLFEIQIDKRYFELMFGAGAKPRNEDYIHLIISNKLYYIHSNYLEKGMNGMPTYWQISLKKYDNDMAMLKSPEVKEYLENVTISREELFAEVEKEEIQDIMNEQQSRRQTIAKDDIREYIDEDVLIVPYELNNNGTIVANHHYDLSQMQADVVSLKYKKPLDLSQLCDFSYTSWFYLQEPDEELQADRVGFSITSIIRIDRYTHELVLDKDITSLSLKKNDYIISSTGTRDILQILDVVGDYTIIVSTQLQPDVIERTHYTKANKNNLFKSMKDRMGIRVDLLDNKYIIISTNKKYFKILLKTELSYGVWYGFVFELGAQFATMATYFYTIVDRFDPKDTRFSTRLDLVNKNTIQFSPEIITGNVPLPLELISSNIKFTNIRLWDHIVKEDSHSIVLNSSFVRNSSKTIIIDNATENFNIPKMGSEI